MSNGAQARPGWYPPDPSTPQELRYWDGARWTDRTTVELAPVTSAAERGKVRNPWWLSWPVIVLGFLCFVIPGVVLLWLRKGTHMAVKIVASALALPVFISGATTSGDDSTTDLPVAAVSPSATASPAVGAAAPVEAAADASAAPTPTPALAAPVATIATVESDPSGITVEEAVVALAVKGRAPTTGYSREMFGDGWIDVDRNGCDTRNDLLRLRLTGVTVSGPCKVTSGDLDDPYTGTSIHFESGGASEVDIDHIVALSDAWQKGATPWAYATRVAFANDPLNLEPVDAGANRQKGDGDAATWLPSNKAYRCEYVGRQVAVKAKYGLWVTRAERDAILRVIDACPGYLLPGPGDQPTTAANTGGPAPTPVPEPAPVETTAAPAPVAEPAPAETTAAPVPAPVETTEALSNPGNSKNCGDFSTWGSAQDWYLTYFPLYGDVAGLDGDDDGVVCESLSGAP